MTEPNRDELILRAVSDWLDADEGGDLDGGNEDAAGVLAGPLAPHDERLVGDLQFLDAVLASLSPQAAAQQSQRLQRALATLQTEPESPPARPAAAAPVRRAARRGPAWVLAASLLLAFSAIWLYAGRESRAVEGALHDMLTASLESVERTYAVQRTAADQAAAPHDVGTLSLRGCDGFVLQCDDVVLGRTRDEYWLVEPDGEVFGRGINSIQLYHDGDRWWITSWIFDQERAGNEIPAEFLPDRAPGR